MNARHSLVIGKFYPPHLGHKFLIDQASANSGQVTVMISCSDHESIPLSQRVAWLRAIHSHQPNVEILGQVNNTLTDYDDPDIWDKHMQIFRKGLGSRLPEIDMIFSSESYGPEMAERLGVPHVMVDASRSTIDVSATRIRTDIVANAEFLHPVVRADLAMRVVCLGAESSGTTTLSRDLAQHYAAQTNFSHTQWVGEYGREYTQGKLVTARTNAPYANPGPSDLTWDDRDFELIAAEQNRLEDLAAQDSGMLVICDTDAFTTGVFQEMYLGHTTSPVRAHAKHTHDLYILTSHDGVPYVQDGLRIGDSHRPRMTKLCRDALDANQHKYIVAYGNPATRLSFAIGVIDAMLETKWSFSPPH
jgi:NadR type nicotinamide-nucleotide adenylyltransferase